MATQSTSTRAARSRRTRWSSPAAPSAPRSAAPSPASSPSRRHTEPAARGRRAHRGLRRRHPWVLREARRHRRTGAGRRSADRRGGSGTLAELFADRQVRLIAGTVLLTIVVKQLVDYQFNVITKEVFESRDAISAFQGKFNAATQWLPLVVLAGCGRRCGAGASVGRAAAARLHARHHLALASRSGCGRPLRPRARRPACVTPRSGPAARSCTFPSATRSSSRRRRTSTSASRRGWARSCPASSSCCCCSSWTTAGRVGQRGPRRGLVHARAHGAAASTCALWRNRSRAASPVCAACSRRSSTPVRCPSCGARWQESPLRTAFALELLAQLPDDELHALADDLQS
jgi:hypothetical protein